MKLVSHEVLHTLLVCDPELGKLFWRERTPDMFNEGNRGRAAHCKAWNTKWAGKEAFTATDANGYKRGAIFDEPFYAHQVIWAMETGAWPVDQIDHEDHDRANNRFLNLKDVTHVVNMRNQKLRSDNKSGVVGVYWEKRSSKWCATIKVNRKDVFLGYRRCITAASIARKIAEQKYGYHPNHGT